METHALIRILPYQHFRTRHPCIPSLASTLLNRRQEYYEELGKASKDLDLTAWLLWFAAASLEANKDTLAQVEFLINKAKLLDKLHGEMNERQEKALLRMFAAGTSGFMGGMSAKNYCAITGAAPATATRDLADLVLKGALTREGEKKATRYHLNIPYQAQSKVEIKDIL